LLLRSVIIHGTVLNDGHIGFTGIYVRGLFLSVISEIDKELAEKLHLPKGFAPYAIKPLSIFSHKGEKGVMYPIEARLVEGTKVSFGFSLLSKELNDISHKIIDKLMDSERIKISDLEISINEISIKELKWSEKSPSVFLVNFKTPTFFRKMGSPYRKLLPEPRALFMSLARIYNQLHGNELDLETLYEQFDKEIGVKKYRLETIRPIDIGRGRLIIGFVGTCVYETQSKELGKLMGNLLQMGEITNVGGSRTLGFGVIEWIPKKE